MASRWRCAPTPSDDGARAAAIDVLAATRPTAVNLRWALEAMRQALSAAAAAPRACCGAGDRAAEIAEEDVAINRAIGEHGLPLIAAARQRKGSRAGGSKSSPIAMPAGWRRSIGEPRWRRSIARMMPASRSTSGSTRPGRAIRAPASPPGSCCQHGVPHTVIADNAGGHLMQQRQGRSLHHRHRPHHRDRRCRQQDRHLSQGAGGARQRRAVLCRAAVADDRLDAR